MLSLTCSFVDYYFAKFLQISNTGTVSDGERPPPQLFFEHLPSFLSDNPNAEYCAKGGHALYADAVDFAYGRMRKSEHPVAIQTAYFQAYHTPLHKSAVST